MMMTYSILQIKLNDILKSFYNNMDNIFFNKTIDDNQKQNLIKELISNNNSSINDVILDVSKQTNHKSLKITELKQFLIKFKETLPSKNESFERDSYSTTSSQDEVLESFFNCIEDYEEVKEDIDLTSNSLQYFITDYIRSEFDNDDNFLNFCFNYRKIIREKALLDFNQPRDNLIEELENLDQIIFTNQDILENSFCFMFPLSSSFYKLYNFLNIYGKFYFPNNL